MVSYGRLKTRQTFKLLALKWTPSLKRGGRLHRLQEVSYIVILTYLENLFIEECIVAL